MNLLSIGSILQKIAMLSICCLTPIITDAQVVSTLIDDFPGDGEMSIDQQGFLYVNDSGMGQILNGTTVLKVDPLNGTYDIFRDNLDPFVVGSMFDVNGDLLVTGWSSGTITKISADGSTTSNVASAIDGAGSLEVDEAGNIYVAEYNQNKVLKFDPINGTRTDFSAGAPIFRPAGLAYVETTGKLYVSNWTNGKIIEIDSNGNAIEFAELLTPNAGPIKIYGNTMLATSPMHHVIYSIDMNNPQNVAVFAGIINVMGHEDGSIDVATFDTPTGIALDGSTLYVAENFNDNGRLRMIEGFFGNEDITSTDIGLTLYPNPAQNILKAQYKFSSAEEVEWHIFDIHGRKMLLPPATMDGEGIELNIESLTSGMYFLHAVISGTKSSGTVSFIKE